MKENSRAFFRQLRIVTVVLSVSIIIACAHQGEQKETLLASLNVGVQADNPLASQLAGMALPGLDSLNALDYQPSQILQRELAAGIYDIAVVQVNQYGQNASVDRASLKDYEHFPLLQVALQYYVLAKRRDLGGTKDKSEFFSKLKAIGYVSTGEDASHNKSVLQAHPQGHMFVPCGELGACIESLKNGKVDALVRADAPSLPSVWATSASDDALAKAKIFEKTAFAIVINTVSLSQAERQVLMGLIIANQQ